MTIGWLLIGFLGLSAYGIDALAAAEAGVPAAVVAAISDPRRPAEQRQLDAARKPALVIAFADVKSGDRIADFTPGNGYFTRILSDVVGAKGRVYAFIPSEQIANCPTREIAGTRAIAHDPSYTNVVLLTGSLANFRMRESSISFGRRKITTICTIPFWDRRTWRRLTERSSMP
jgi:predicted methyltransferase